jgi:uncharacterized membrane protein HdeD (DUF308 family)
VRTGREPEKGTRHVFKSWSDSIIVPGILAFIVGLIAIIWPGVTILALIILFAAYCFMDAIIEPTRAFSSDRAGHVIGHLLLALISVAAGIVVIVWPGSTALVLVAVVVAVWAIAGGFVEFFAGFRSGQTAGTRALLILAGLVSVAFGIVIAAGPGIGAVTAALLFGLYSMIYGISLTVPGIQGRHAGNTLDSATSQLRPA